jgi:hypothetical protein
MERRRSAASAIGWIAAHTDRVIWAIGLGMLVAYLGVTAIWPKPNGRVIFGDATHHYVQLRSLVFDHDFDFKNEYLRIYGLKTYEPGTEWIFTDLTPTGHVRNYMPLGPALLWAPLYLVVVAVLKMLSAFDVIGSPDGFEYALQLVPGVTGVVASTAAAWLAWRLARRFVDPFSAAVGVLAGWLGSSAVYYSLVSPSYSHAASMFACAVFFSHWLGHRGPWTAGRVAASGALVGLATLMRWQDALLMIVPIFEAVRSPMPWLRRVLAGAAAIAAAAVVFSPQMAVWHALYGRWLAMPQGPSFVQWTSPHPIDVLLSDNHGLLAWTPIVALSLVGLAQFAWRERRVALPLAAVVIGAWYVNASVADWWAGEAFGARRFLSLFPLFVVGLSTWVASPRLRAVRLALVAVLVIGNGLLLLQYEVFMKGYRTIAPYPAGWVNLWIARFVVPVRLVGRWLR